MPSDQTLRRNNLRHEKKEPFCYDMSGTLLLDNKTQLKNFAYISPAIKQLGSYPGN